MQKHLLIIGFVWPEPNSSAAGSRMMQLIECFHSEDYQITFASPCAKSDNAFDLSSIDIAQESIELNNSSFDVFIKELNPSVVLFDRFMMEEQFGWRVLEQCPNALRILDTEDLHCLRKGRQQAFKEGQSFNDSYLFNETAKREIASIYRCDFSLIISKAEMDLLKQRFKVADSLLCYVPFLINKPSSETIQDLPKFDKRKHFITIGNFLHEPNYNSILYLKESIWPLIRKELPQAEMHIYGAYVSPKVIQLNNEKDGFHIKGFAEDVNLVMQNAKVCLAPLRFGAGLKGKLFDAMLNGTPSVTTTIGAEGMVDTIFECGFISDEPQEFSNRAVALYSNENVWVEKHKNGFRLMNAHFNKKDYQMRFINRFNQILENLDEFRFQNFTGQMLMHHQLQSTKYLSRWIEEKNKK